MVFGVTKTYTIGVYNIGYGVYKYCYQLAYSVCMKEPYIGYYIALAIVPSWGLSVAYTYILYG